MVGCIVLLKCIDTCTSVEEHALMLIRVLYM